MTTADGTKKIEKVSNKSEPKKTELKKSDSVKNEAGKTEALSTPGTSEKKPQSASQTSISHFSSVSTPEYRKGWDNIFGAHKEITEHNETAKRDLPKLLSVENKDIETSLRHVLDEVFETIAVKEGYEFKELKKFANLSYKISCEFKRK